MRFTCADLSLVFIQVVLLCSVLNLNESCTFVPGTRHPTLDGQFRASGYVVYGSVLDLHDCFHAQYYGYDDTAHVFEDSSDVDCYTEGTLVKVQVFEYLKGDNDILPDELVITVFYGVGLCTPDPPPIGSNGTFFLCEINGDVASLIHGYFYPGFTEGRHVPMETMSIVGCEQVDGICRDIEDC